LGCDVRDPFGAKHSPMIERQQPESNRAVSEKSARLAPAEASDPPRL
jgi:hypothetical protein